jgi:trigger factor
MNVQTEHLENHTARLTVELDADMLNQEMRKVARSISRKARIPGFRPGKAPFNVVVNMVGYDYVLGETMEKIGDKVYRDALEASGIEPYGPGSLEKIEEGGQRLVFTFPKEPTVELGDYRAVRVEYEEQEVDDAMVDRAMENLRQEQAIVEDVDRPAKFGDQVVLSHVEISVLVEDTGNEDEDESEEESDAETGADAVDELNDELDDDELDDLDDEDEDQRRVLIHEHNYEYVLFEDPDDEMLVPGFAAELADTVAGDELEFYLEIPEDDEDENIAGRTLFCEAFIDQVQARTVPEWTDDLAKRISEDEFETILELRIHVREQLGTQMENVARQEIAGQALEKLVEGAAFAYPNELIDDNVDDYVRQLEQNIARQGIKLADWLRLTQQTEDDLREQYREMAEQRARRTLVLAELVKIEELGDVSDELIETEIDRMAEAMSGTDQAQQFRQFLDSDYSRSNIANELVTNRAYDRLVAIAKGEDPPIGVQPDEDADEDTGGSDNQAEEDAEAHAEIATETGADIAELGAGTEVTAQAEPAVEATTESDPEAEAVDDTD